MPICAGPFLGSEIQNEQNKQGNVSHGAHILVEVEDKKCDDEDKNYEETRARWEDGKGLGRVLVLTFNRVIQKGIFEVSFEQSKKTGNKTMKLGSGWCWGAEEGCPVCSKNSKNTDVATGGGRGREGSEWVQDRDEFLKDLSGHCKGFGFYEMEKSLGEFWGSSDVIWLGSKWTV